MSAKQNYLALGYTMTSNMRRKNKELWKNSLAQKLRKFKSAGNTNRSPTRISKKYSVTDVINKFGKTPKCYLTGKKIDLVSMDQYSLDHRKRAASNCPSVSNGQNIGHLNRDR